jgi:glycosyltransferase involved in cell wall biosynthesis
VASDRERIELQQRSPSAALDTLPNGVDVDHYAGLGNLQNEIRRDVLFVGSMDYHANIDAALWMVREAWPQIRLLCPGLRLAIVGRKPAPSVRALAADDIVITGTVDDVRPFYARALAVAAPLRVGSGTRLKILEAMAAGVPVVSTRLGAEGLDIHDQRDILLADTGEAFATAISRLASTPELRQRLALAGRELVVQSYDWASLGERLYAIHQRARNTRQ